MGKQNLPPPPHRFSHASRYPLHTIPNGTALTETYWHYVRQFDVGLKSDRRIWCHYDVVLMSMLVLRILVNVVPFSIVGGDGKKKIWTPLPKHEFSLKHTIYPKFPPPPSNMYFFLKKMLPSSPNIDFHMFPAQSYNAKGCPFNTIEWGREAKIHTFFIRNRFIRNQYSNFFGIKKPSTHFPSA